MQKKDITLPLFLTFLKATASLTFLPGNLAAQCPQREGISYLCCFLTLLQSSSTHFPGRKAIQKEKQAVVAAGEIVSSKLHELSLHIKLSWIVQGERGNYLSLKQINNY